MACEKCWHEALDMVQRGQFQYQGDAYAELLKRASNGERPICSPTEQCGDKHSIPHGAAQCACGRRKHEAHHG